VFVLPDHDFQFLQYGEFNVNFVAALEDSLVRALVPRGMVARKDSSIKGQRRVLVDDYFFIFLALA